MGKQTTSLKALVALMLEGGVKPEQPIPRAIWDACVMEGLDVGHKGAEDATRACRTLRLIETVRGSAKTEGSVTITQRALDKLGPLTASADTGSPGS